MKSITKLDPQDWMKAAETRTIISALGAGAALFVGGAVRNALLGVAVDDIDIATILKPEQVIAQCAAAEVKTIPTGIDHGTVTAVVNGKPFEITTLRKDLETDGRRAVVGFSNDWGEDARRRDFTMNTLLMNIDGEVFDPLGQGLDHLRARKVVFVGDPKQRIAEDYLRILRYFRFCALYGRGEMDEGALSACHAASSEIKTLSKERITQEFFKILSVDNPVSVLDIMFENNILTELSKVGYDSEFLTHLCTFQNNYSLGFLSARLLALVGLKAEGLTLFEEFLLIPKVFRRDIQAISQILLLPDLSNDHAVKVAIYHHGRVPTAQSLMIELANDRVMNGYAPAALDIIQNWDIPNFPISGEDLIKEGQKPGPALGAELQRREAEWIEKGFTL